MDQKDEQGREKVRLISRIEADAAIESGEVVTRSTMQRTSLSSEGGESRPSMSFPLIEGEVASQVVARPKLSAKPATEFLKQLDPDSALDLRMSQEQRPLDGKSESDSTNTGEPTGSVPQLPHWTEPPSGEVPAAVESSGPRWRYEHTGNSEVSFEDLTDVSGLDSPTDIEGDEPEASPSVAEAVEVVVEEIQAETPREKSGFEAATERGTRFRQSDKPSFLTAAKNRLVSKAFARRVGTALVFALIALAAFGLGPAWTMLMCGIVVLIAAVEYFDALRRVGYRPAALLALLGVAGAMFGTYARGESAILLAVTLTLIFSFLWYMSGVIKGNALANVAVTMLGVLWTGVLGSYAGLLLRMPSRHGMAFVLGAVLCTIAYDSFAYIGGNVIGRHRLSPAVSPNKTWEGLAVGTVASIAVGALGISAMHPWTVIDGLWLGIVVAVVAPLGDLAESMIKRDLGLKDMGRLLPGHGGALDRFDALLFVLPATYYLVRVLNLG